MQAMQVMQFETNSHGGWVVPANTAMPDGTEIPAWSDLGESCVLGAGCKIGDDCKIGAGCRLGAGCKFGAYCRLGNDCRLGESCTLGANTQWLGVTVESWLTLANVDGSGRPVKIIKHAEGVRVEAGCFQGTLEEFCIQAASEGKDRYVRVISAVAAAM